MMIEDNVNQYAVKFKLGKRKIERERINKKQIKVYNRLLETISNRKAPLQAPKQVTQQSFIRPNEVEREFLDAFSVILQSGYYLEQDDFIQLLKISDVHAQATHVVDRAKIFEFFNYAA